MLVGLANATSQFLNQFISYDKLETRPVINDLRFDYLMNELNGLEGLYYYSGSKTVPPCTEGVLWFVSGTYLKISPADLELFLMAMPPSSARPIQINQIIVPVSSSSVSNIISPFMLVFIIVRMIW